jgi:3-oxoacyl-[acyl-carrier protein] reductase
MGNQADVVQRPEVWRDAAAPVVQRVAFVSGGMGGIGTAICRRLGRAGHVVVAGCLPDYGKKAEWLDRMRTEGLRVHAAEGDVANYESCSQMFSSLASSVGPVDILVNNAGITRDGLLFRMSETDWNEVISTNLTSCFHWTKLLGRPMTRARWGRIVNITSVSGILGNAGQANYSAAKAGMIGLTKTLAREFAGRSVTVNAVAPGFIKTDMTTEFVNNPEISTKILETVPLKRFGEAADIANLVAYLSSEEAGYITGQVFAVDGGMAM